MEQRGLPGFIQVGAISELKQLQKKFKPPTRAQLQMIEASVAINDKIPDAAELAFMARQLVLCTLPHSDPGDVPRWLRRTGTMALVLQPGWDAHADKSIGYPYGTIPRLMLFWIVTEAVKTGKRRLLLGRSLAQFMREVGLDPNRGGKRSDHTRLKAQMRRLFRCQITFDAGDGDGDHWKDMKVAPEGEFWWSHKEPEQGALWESWIELGGKFFQAVLESPVPIDTRALKTLKRSPLALDLYAWITFRTFVILQKKQPPQFIAWVQLMRQFGGDYANVDEFARKARGALNKIKIVYPGLVLGTVPGGFTIHADRPAVLPKESAKLLG